MNGKGSDQRPERIPGSYKENWERIFSKGVHTTVVNLAVFLNLRDFTAISVAESLRFEEEAIVLRAKQ